MRRRGCVGQGPPQPVAGPGVDEGDPVVRPPSSRFGPPPERWGDDRSRPGSRWRGATFRPGAAGSRHRQATVSGTTQHKLRAAIDRLTPGQRHTLIEQWRFEQLPAVDQLDLDQFMAALDLILDVIADDDHVYEEPDPDRDADADTYRYDPADDDGRPF